MSNRQWIERALPCDPWQRCAAWASQPGTLLLHDALGTSALLFAPRWTVRLQANGQLLRSGELPPNLPMDDNPADWPARWSSAFRAARRRSPLFCGIAGQLSYELGTLPWHAVAARRPPVAAPQLSLGLYDRALLFDPQGAARLVVASLAPLADSPGPLERRWNEAAEQLLLQSPPVGGRRIGRPSAIETLDRTWHRRSFDRIQRYLRAGDVYQINLTGQLLAHADVDPFELFRRECATNPVSHAAFAQLGDMCISSHSPERLLTLRGNAALSSPIKGTAAPGDDDLGSSAKDRAEHVMIVDLVRNDLGRSARTGSVRVRSLMHALQLRGLQHLESHVESHLRRGARARILGDLFPGGSITGAPKRRAIEIIAELERCQRGVYTGSIGYFDCAGHADWNIAIRTAVWQNGRVAFGCGGGIVLDSDPEREYAEALLKAQSFLGSLRAMEAQSGSASRCSSITTEL